MSDRDRFIYAQVDVDIIDHPKTAIAGPAALAVYLAAICLCRKHQSDGRIPIESAKALLGGAGAREWASLTSPRVGWFIVDGDEVEVFNYAKKNQTRAEIESNREAARERQRKSRASRGDVTPVTCDIGVSHASSHMDVPSSSSLSESGSGSQGEGAGGGDADGAPEHRHNPTLLVEHFNAGVASGGISQSMPFGAPLRGLGEAIDKRVAGTGLPPLEAAKALGVRWLGYCAGAPGSPFRAIDWLNSGAPKARAVGEGAGRSRFVSPRQASNGERRVAIHAATGKEIVTREGPAPRPRFVEDTPVGAGGVN